MNTAAHAGASVVRPIPSQHRPNVSTVWRVCHECQFEIGWPINQTSVALCPYCGMRFAEPSVWDHIIGAALNVFTVLGVVVAALAIASGVFPLIRRLFS